MPDKITFYAVVAADRTVDNPYGLLRRLETDWGFTDEGLRKDLKLEVLRQRLSSGSWW